MDNNHFSIYDTTYQANLYGHLKFETKSVIGRLLFGKPPPRLHTAPQLLNLGCGPVLYPEFVNADFFKLLTRSPGPHFWGLDLRYPLNCADNYWDGIYTEHTLEHLPPSKTLALLHEIHRTLKSGCWVRIIIPDLAKYVDYYSGKPSDGKFSAWQPRAAALHSVAQKYFHMSLWDLELMTSCLTRAGFKAINQRAFGEGVNKRLLKDSADREFESLYVEAQKE